MTPAERAVREYARGRTARQVAATLDVDESTIRRWLHDSGTVLRRPGPPEASVKSALIVQLRDRRGMTWGEIAETVGMSQTGVRRRYRAATDETFTRW
jgi:DNA-directed RNA polymerase specialized sigma24 family protein